MDSVLIVHQEDKFVKIVDNISSILEKKGIKTYHRERSCLTSDCHEGNDLIIVVGGDGTFLRASHLNLDRPIFGINPDPEKKEGFFMQATSHDYEKKLDSVLEGDFKIIEMLRLQAEINGKKIEEISLNEIFIGDKKPYNMFNYFIELGKEREFQRGSGILIATPAGSNAWMKAAGGVVMDKADMRYQFFARDLYRGNLTPKYLLDKGILRIDQEISFECKTPGIVVIDSISPEYNLGKGDRIRIYVSDHPLRYVLP